MFGLVKKSEYDKVVHDNVNLKNAVMRLNSLIAKANGETRIVLKENTKLLQKQLENTGNVAIDEMHQGTEALLDSLSSLESYAEELEEKVLEQSALIEEYEGQKQSLEAAKDYREAR